MILKPENINQVLFWQKVYKSEDLECWIWTAHRSPLGYGRLAVRGGKYAFAHRAAFVLVTGEPLDSSEVLRHTCDTPSCVNPSHLKKGTQQENMTDMVARARQARGSKHGVSKLVEDQVREIRRLYGTGRYSQQALADLFDCSRSNIGLILQRLRWGHLS